MIHFMLTAGRDRAKAAVLRTDPRGPLAARVIGIGIDRPDLTAQHAYARRDNRCTATPMAAYRFNVSFDIVIFTGLSVTAYRTRIQHNPNTICKVVA